MKKIFIAALLLPFSLFAQSYSLSQDDFISIRRVCIYTFSSFHASNFVYSSQSSISPSTVSSVIFNSVNGIKFNVSNSKIYNPDFTFPVSTNSFLNSIDSPVQATTSFNPGFISFYRLSAFDRMFNLYNAVVRLYISGYRGNGFRDIFYGDTSSTKDYVALNFYFPDIVSDVIASTNTAFSKILFDSLSSIDSNISSLSSSLSSFQQSYQSVNLPVFDFSKYLDHLVENGQTTQANADAWQRDYDYYSFDPAFQCAYAQSVKSTIDSIANTKQALSTLQNLANNNPSQLSDIGNSFNGSVEGAVQDFKRLSTNWQEGVKRQLQDWRNDVTNRLAHMFDENIPIDGGNSKPVYVSGANGGPIGVAGVVRLDGPISVGATIEGPVTLDATQINQFSSGWESIRQSIIDFHNSFTDFTTSGDLPFNWISFYRLFYDFQDHSLSNQLAMIRTFSVTNILNDIYAAITNNSTNVVLSAMLLDDYETFIDSSKFSDMLLAMPENLSSTLRAFGLSDSSEYAGRWWVFQTANSMLQSQMLITNATLSALALSALNDIDNSFDDDDSEDSSLLSRWLSILSTLPDKEELDQAIESASNIVNNVGFDRVNVFYDRATNDFSSALSTMYQDRSLPTYLRITIVPESHGRPPRFVDIPVAERAGLWSLFRSGMAYGLSIVTLILFPKYILWLLTRYTRLMEKIIKSLKAYTHM